MPTKITYLYRDAGNYKARHEVIILGKLSFAQVQPFLQDGCLFIPTQVDLPDLQRQLGPATEDDHAWHELGPESFTPTAEPITVAITARTLLSRFRQAHAHGWDLAAGDEELSRSHRATES
jgi:hypothetical protein